MRLRNYLHAFFLLLCVALVLLHEALWSLRSEVAASRSEAASFAAREHLQRRGDGAVVDPVSFGILDHPLPWPEDLSVHRAMAETIQKLPRRESELHQIPADVRSTRVMYIVNSFDRKQLREMLVVLRSAVVMCEFGWDLEVAFLITHLFGDEPPSIPEALYCARIGRTVERNFYNFTPEVENRLATFSRLVIGTHIRDFEFFIYAENDMNIQLHHALLFLWETALLPGDYLPGLQRYVYHEGKMTTPAVEYVAWQGSDVTVIHVDGRWYYHPVNPHQSHFMLTRQQVEALAQRCGFLDTSRTACNPLYLREFMSSLQIFGDFLCPACNLTKVVPAMPEAYFRHFLVHHLTNISFAGPGVPGIHHGGMPMERHHDGIAQCVAQAQREGGLGREVSVCRSRTLHIDITGLL
eukprot:RCo043229